MYIYQQPAWPNFTWQHEQLEPLLGAVRHQQGRVLGQMEALGFALQADATFETLTLDVLKSSEIEGEYLPADQVRSSLARQQQLLNLLLDGFEGKLTSSKWAAIAKCSQDTAMRDIQALIEQHVLVKEAGGRSTAYRLAP